MTDTANSKPEKAGNLALKREQVEENFRFANAASIAGVFNAVIAVVTLWSPALAIPLLIWGVAILLGAVARVAMIRSSRGGPHGAEHYRLQRRRIELIALYNGVVWGAGVGALAFVADHTQFLLLIILCSGMMGASVTTYTSQARAGMFFTLPLAAGGLLSLWVHSDAPAFAGTLFLACYLFLLVRGGYARQQRFNARIRGREQLRESAETVKLLLNDYESQASDWLWEVNKNGIIQDASARFATVSGRDAELLEDMRFADLFDPGKEVAMLESSIAIGHGFRNLTLRLTINGAPHWWTLSAQPLDCGGMRGVASDVTAQKRAEERVSYMAHYDGLTDLANRFLFSDTLKRAVKLHTNPGEIAVLCLDLDNFKAVNDTLGHPVGDKLLCQAARRVEKIVKQNVAFDATIGRLGGDEFAVLLVGEGAAENAPEMAQQMLASIAEPCLIDGSQVVASTSIGIATLGSDNSDADTLIKQADLALYAAKANGRNRTATYEAGMDEAAQARRALEMDLRNALAKNEFELHFQPLINIETAHTVGYEALIRWIHPERGVVMPDDFIPIAEETGLIVQLGEWVIREATAEVAKWPNHLRVSVNLSPIQMRSANLIGTVLSAIANANIEPSRLELEITENVLLHDSEINIATLHKLRDFGVRISLDDFGTGYSSLNYLRSFPFDKIKIDRCFVNDLENNAECQAIIQAVTGLASSLGMETTAEGVEGLSQLEHLRAHGCTEAQGYLFSRPERSESFTDLRSPKPHGKMSIDQITDLAIGQSKPNDNEHPAAPAKSAKRG